MTVQLSPNGKWLYGDAPRGIAATLANTVIAIREEGEGTWVSTSQGVAVLFTGNQAMAVYNLIKDTTIIVV